MGRTVIVEPHPTGHRFQHVAHITRAAAGRGDDVVLLTSTGATDREEFHTFLDALPLTVQQPFDGWFPPARAVARELRRIHADEPLTTIVLLDADQQLKRWWWAAPRAFRRRGETTTVLLLMRMPQDVSAAEPRLLAMRWVKIGLTALARGTRAADRVLYLVGRHPAKRVPFHEQLRDPAICLSHSRDRASLRAEHGLPAGRHLVGVFGEISIRKCVPMLVEAIRLAGDDVDLLLAGPITDDMQEFLDRLPAEHRARVHTRLGFLAEDVIDACVAMSDVVSIAMLNPGPSGIQGKALLAGVPVLNAGSALRAKETADLGAGITVDLDAPSLAAGIRTLVDDPIDVVPPADLPTGEEYGAVMLGIFPHGP